MIDEKIINAIRVKPGKKVDLADYPTTWAVTPAVEELGKKKVKARAEEILEAKPGRARSVAGTALCLGYLTPCWRFFRGWTPRAKTGASNT